jgi:hypothetical protein
MRAPTSAADGPASPVPAEAVVAAGAPKLAWGWPGFFFAEQEARAAASTKVINTHRVNMC